MKKYLSIFCLIITMMAGYAHAGTVYTDRALFEAAVSTYTIEDFEAYPISGNPGSGAVEAKERATGNLFEELRSIGKKARSKTVEHFFGQATWVCVGFEHQGRNG